MRDSKEWEPLYLRGTPPHLSGVMPAGAFSPGRVSVSLDLPVKVARSVPTKARVARADGAGFTCLHLDVPDITPPGDYRGTVEIDKQARAIVVEIKPQPRLRLLPDEMRLEARPGARVEFGLTVMNVGNVTIEVPDAAVFGLYDKEGLDRAIGGAFLAGAEGEGGRLDRLVESASEGHGGIVQLKITAGHGALEPGSARELRMELRIPKKAAPGRPYFGWWKIGDLSYHIAVDVAPEATAPAPKGRN
jgi:hypothetical protein